MSSRNIAVSGLYFDHMSAGEAADALQRIGFRSTDSSILVPDNLGTKDFGHEKHTKAPEGAALGALIGILVGAGLGWLVSAGYLANVQWLARFAAIGPIGAILSGAGAGSILGWIIGAFAGSPIPEYEAVRYEGRTRKGGVLLSVHCDNPDWVRRAKDTLRQTGAKAIAARSEAKADFGASEKPLLRTRATSIRAKEAEMRPEDVEVHEDEPASVHTHLDM